MSAIPPHPPTIIRLPPNYPPIIPESTQPQNESAEADHLIA